MSIREFRDQLVSTLISTPIPEDITTEKHLIRTVDRERLGRRLGKLSSSTLGRVLAILQEMFTP